MRGNQKDDYIPTASDIVIFEEAARRIKDLYRRQLGMNLEYGSFEFIFENGRLTEIDECHSNTFFRMPFLRPVS